MVPQWDIQNVSLSKNEKYIRETNKCFWKAPEDVNNSVKTGSQKTPEILRVEDMMDYLKKKTIEKIFIINCSCNFLLVLIKNC